MAVPPTLTILPRDMIIKQGNDHTVWKWCPEGEACELLRAQSVFACGALVKPQLQPVTTYDVTFHVAQIIKTRDPSYIFEVEVPDGQSLKQHATLRVGHSDIKLSFKTPAHGDYEYVHVYIYRIDFDTPEKGLIIERVSVTPATRP